MRPAPVKTLSQFAVVSVQTARRRPNWHRLDMIEFISKLCEIEVIKLPLICILAAGWQLTSSNMRPWAALPGSTLVSDCCSNKMLSVHMLEMGFLMELCVAADGQR